MSDHPDIHLNPPSLDLLPAYVAALEGGWSPNTTRNVAPEQLAAIAADPAGFVHDQGRHEGRFQVIDGLQVPFLPFRVYWITDGAGDFVGAINVRWPPDLGALPPWCSGHVGYSIVPRAWGRGVATRALALLLGRLRDIVPLERVVITCDATNPASRRVIEKNGGVLVDSVAGPNGPKLVFDVLVPAPAGVG